MDHRGPCRVAVVFLRQQACVGGIRMSKKLPAVFFVFALIGLCITVGMRVMLAHTYTDPSTGFYTGAYTAPTFALNILVAIWAVVLLVPLFLPRKAVDADPLPQKQKALGMMSGLAALALFFASIGLFVSLVTTGTSGSLFLDALFTLAAAIYFAVQAREMLSGRRLHAMAALLPAAWATVHLVVTWMHFTTVTNVPEHLFDFLKMTVFMLFFYYHARLVGGVPSGREQRGVLSFGLLALFFGLLSVVPPLLVQLSGGKSAFFSFTDSIATVVLCAYILVLCIQLFFRRPATDVPKIRSAV